MRRYARVVSSVEIIATSQRVQFPIAELEKAQKYDVKQEADPNSKKVHFVNRAFASTEFETTLNIHTRRRAISGHLLEDPACTVPFDLVASAPKKPATYEQLEKKNGVFLLWTYYRDGYGIGRSGSNVGTYMGLGNFSPVFRNFSEAISTLNHHPQGFNAYDSTVQVRDDSARLRNGVKMWLFREEKLVDVKGVLAIAKTDSQELLKYLNHGSFKNHGCCPHCQVGDSVDP
jgi:hypothetical protein